MVTKKTAPAKNILIKPTLCSLIKDASSSSIQWAFNTSNLPAFSFKIKPASRIKNKSSLADSGKPSAVMIKIPLVRYLLFQSHPLKLTVYPPHLLKPLLSLGFRVACGVADKNSVTATLESPPLLASSDFWRCGGIFMGLLNSV